MTDSLLKIKKVRTKLKRFNNIKLFFKLQERKKNFLTILKNHKIIFY